MLLCTNPHMGWLYQTYIIIGRASLVFIFRDVTRFTPLLARLVQ